jgi:hypothetical protein
MSASHDDHLFECMEIARQKYEEGNKAVLLMAIHLCFLMKKPVPDWLRLSFIEAYQQATAFNIRSWDEVFAPPVKKRTQLEKRKKYVDLRYPIAIRVISRGAKAIDKSLFDEIGRELNISGTTASDIYYKHGGKELLEMIEPLSEEFPLRR